VRFDGSEERDGGGAMVGKESWGGGGVGNSSGSNERDGGGAMNREEGWRYNDGGCGDHYWWWEMREKGSSGCGERERGREGEKQIKLKKGK